VRAPLDKYHARYKRSWDSPVRPKNKDLAVGDFFYLHSHHGGHKLLPKALGPFEILDTDGTYFTIDQGDGEGRVNGNDATPAPRPVSGPDSQRHRLTQAPLPDIVGSRAHMHLDVMCCISPHLERCTRHQDSSRRALRNICLHLVVIF